MTTGSSPDCDRLPTSQQAYGAQLLHHKKTLEYHMEYEYGLNEIIIEQEIFTIEEISKFDAIKKDSVRVNRVILESLCKKSDIIHFEKFLYALEESLQSHFKRLIIQNGNFKDGELDRPLTEPQISYLRRNQRKITSNMHTQVDDLANRLLEKYCINEYHFQKLDLKSHITNLERAATMMFIMRNRSLKHFLLFREILKETNSLVYDVTNIENEEECIVAVSTVNQAANAEKDSCHEDVPNCQGNCHGDLNGENVTSVTKVLHDDNILAGKDILNAKDMTNVGAAATVSNGPRITNVSSKIETKLMEKAIVEHFSARDYNSNDINVSNIIGLKKDQSINVYIRCPTIESLARLRKSVENGSMRSSLEILYNDLLEKKKCVFLKVKRVFMVDFKIQEFYQICDKNQADVSDNMQDHELLRNGKKEMQRVLVTDKMKLEATKQRILLIAYFCITAQNIESNTGSAHESHAFNMLSSVCNNWWNTLKMRNFKNFVKIAKTTPLRTKVLFRNRGEYQHLQRKENYFRNDKKNSVLVESVPKTAKPGKPQPPPKPLTQGNLLSNNQNLTEKLPSHYQPLVKTEEELENMKSHLYNLENFPIRAGGWEKSDKQKDRNKKENELENERLTAEGSDKVSAAKLELEIRKQLSLSQLHENLNFNSPKPNSSYNYVYPDLTTAVALRSNNCSASEFIGNQEKQVVSSYETLQYNQFRILEESNEFEHFDKKLYSGEVEDYDYPHDLETNRWMWIDENIGPDMYMKNSVIRRVVKAMYMEILSAVHDINSILDWFIQENVFSIYKRQKILAPHSPRDRCRNMLDALLSSTHSTAFVVFLNAMNEQCPWIVKRINQDVDTLLNDPKIAESLQNTQSRRSLNINPSTSFSAPSLPYLSTSNYDSAYDSEAFGANKGNPHKNFPTFPTTGKSGSLPQSKPRKPMPQKKLRSALRHLGDQLTVQKHLLTIKDEELRQCQLRIEFLERNHNGSGGANTAQGSITLSERKELHERLRRSEERNKYLGDKLRPLEEREKALIAQLEFYRGLIQNQLYQGQNQISDLGLALPNDGDDLETECYDDLFQASSLQRETKLKSFYNANDNVQKVPASSTRAILWKHLSPPIAPRPLPNPPALPTRQEIEGDYGDISLHGPANKTLNDFEIKPDNIEILEEVFSTRYTNICKGKLKISINSVREVAIKRLNIQDQDALKIFLNEAEVLIQLQHLNVIKIEGVITASHPCHIILENLNTDNLLYQLQKDKGQHMIPQLLVNFSKMIADGMNYLEKNNYVHRGLDARAILLTNEPHMFDRIAKISKFRLAAYVGDTNGLFEDYQTISNLSYYRNIEIKWTAPEALKTKIWTIRSDVWSYGVLLYEMFTYGEKPYPDINDSELVQILDSSYRLPCPTSSDENTQEVYNVIYNQVMLKCWDIIAENRPSFSNLSDFLETLSIEEADTSASNTQDNLGTVTSTTFRRTAGSLDVNRVGLNRVPSFIRDRYSAYPKFVREIIPETENSAVGGITILNRMIYIARQGTCIIEVYDKDYVSFKTVRPKFRLNISGKSVRIEPKVKTGSRIISSLFRRKKKPVLQDNPDRGLTDIVALPNKGWLFCADPSECRIHRFDPSDIAGSHKCWQVEGDPKTLAVDKNENLYISCSELGAVQIYSSDGRFIRKINTEIATFGPMHAVPIGGDKIIYCHEQEDANSSYVSGQVWICDKSGGNVEKLSSSDWFCSSTYLAVDPYSNQIICVDPVLRSVWLMSSSGRSQARELLPLNRTGIPVRICLRRNSGELYVGMQDGRVLVYEVIRNTGATSRYETWYNNNNNTDESANLYEQLTSDL